MWTFFVLIISVKINLFFTNKQSLLVCVTVYHPREQNIIRKRKLEISCLPILWQLTYAQKMNIHIRSLINSLLWRKAFWQKSYSCLILLLKTLWLHANMIMYNIIFTGITVFFLSSRLSTIITLLLTLQLTFKRLIRESCSCMSYGKQIWLYSMYSYNLDLS